MKEQVLLAERSFTGKKYFMFRPESANNFIGVDSS